MELDEAVAKLLDLSPSSLTVSPVGGGASFAQKAKVTVQDHRGLWFYFIKFATGEDARVMFLGLLKK